MPIDFPNSPTAGDSHSAAGKTWTYDGSTWVLYSATAEIPNQAITESKIANGAVTGSKLADGSVTAIKIPDGTITSAKIANGTITNDDIASGANINISKLSGNGIAQMLVNGDNGYPQYRTITGDWTMSSNGVATISNTAIITVNSATITNKLILSEVEEACQDFAGAAGGSITIDWMSGSTLFYRSSATSNFQFNLRGNSVTPFNSIAVASRLTTVTVMVTTANPAYYMTSFSIDGSTQTVRWQGGTAPTSGNVSSVDVYTFAIYKTNALTYTVFGSRTQFA